MPMDKRRYPENWKQIAREKKESVGWVCEFCGKQCRRPGEPFDTHRRTLTVAHMNHTPEDCRPENMKALCAPCHLKYDAKHHAETRKRRQSEVEEKRCCENCGRLSCANSAVAYLWNLCVEDGFQKYWIPKKEESQKNQTEEAEV